jgi:dephospho-CoA kinase
MGDVIRAACRDRGLDPATHHGEVAGTLREENGPGAIAGRSLPMIEDALADATTVVVEGIRSDVEVEIFEDAFGEGFTLVSIEAPFGARAERIDARDRDDAGAESLRERDERELGFGMDAAMDSADVTVENTGSLKSFREAVRELFATTGDR